jgi:hypothetical protein
MALERAWFQPLDPDLAGFKRLLLSKYAAFKNWFQLSRRRYVAGMLLEAVESFLRRERGSGDDGGRLRHGRDVYSRAF